MTTPATLPPCLLCGATDGTLSASQPCPRARCSCGLVYAAGVEGTAASAYAESYYQGSIYADYSLDRPAIRANARRALSELERVVQGRRLLDVGCAYGYFLEAAAERGWQVWGQEVSRHAWAEARRVLGNVVTLGSVEDTPPAVEEVEELDLITMWDVIEHLARPDEALRRLRALLAPGGRIVFSTGDHGSLLRRLTGDRWRLFQDPTHRFFFDRSTIRRLVEGAGLAVEDIHRRGKHVSVNMILQQSPLRVLRGLARKGLLRHAYLYVNLWDVMTVRARRTD